MIPAHVRGVVLPVYQRPNHCASLLFLLPPFQKHPIWFFCYVNSNVRIEIPQQLGSSFQAFPHAHPTNTW
ncbi:hypothetical protein PILCRDRAFT_452982 [Piloderma croceum F 1598]|uniref:Uncharacterized protein n=1 Tax=Piloderma croceum (strain F 1598) TaxID=765440 RepID=A0A0C3FUR1_PILCF|nr:hypothetical protein PILCRDRAFT_452982 [Piloderma croceum F 1598]